MPSIGVNLCNLRTLPFPMLALLFHIGSERFGLDAKDIVVIVPQVELTPPSQSSDLVIGEFSYHGSIVPVIDLGRLVGQSPSPTLLSTRLILVRHVCATGQERLLGLLAEKVTETVTITAEQLHITEQQLDVEAFKTPLQIDGLGTVQLLHIDRLLPPSIRELLF